MKEGGRKRRGEREQKKWKGRSGRADIKPPHGAEDAPDVTTAERKEKRTEKEERGTVRSCTSKAKRSGDGGNKEGKKGA